jgi:hypothetical protein
LSAGSRGSSAANPTKRLLQPPAARPRNDAKAINVTVATAAVAAAGVDRAARGTRATAVKTVDRDPRVNRVVPAPRIAAKANTVADIVAVGAGVDAAVTAAMAAIAARDRKASKAAAPSNLDRAVN